jgi:CopG family nickel-responsive transcriptional regulator
MSVVSVSMPEELVDRIDQFADDHGYTGRSEVLREASRNLLGEFEDRKLEDRELMGVVTVLFDYETTSVEEKMMHLRHEHEDIVASNFHSHVGGHHCMELFVLEGSLEEISAFVGKIRLRAARRRLRAACRDGLRRIFATRCVVGTEPHG